MRSGHGNRRLRRRQRRKQRLLRQAAKTLAPLCWVRHHLARRTGRSGVWACSATNRSRRRRVRKLLRTAFALNRRPGSSALNRPASRIRLSERACIRAACHKFNARKLLFRRSLSRRVPPPHRHLHQRHARQAIPAIRSTAHPGRAEERTANTSCGRQSGPQHRWSTPATVPATAPSPATTAAVRPRAASRSTFRRPIPACP